MADLIDRQAAIDALKIAYWDEYIQSAKDDPCIIDALTDWAIRQIKALPSAEPTQTNTHNALKSLDCISRQAAIALAKDICVPIKDGTVYRHRCIDPDAIKELPSECNVIYCKDCMFYFEHRCQATRGLDDWRGQDDFCSRAERKTDG